MPLIPQLGSCGSGSCSESFQVVLRTPDHSLPLSKGLCVLVSALGSSQRTKARVREGRNTYETNCLKSLWLPVIGGFSPGCQYKRGQTLGRGGCVLEVAGGFGGVGACSQSWRGRDWRRAELRGGTALPLQSPRDL